MSVTSITLLTESNAFDATDPYDEGPQGAEYPLVRVFVVESDDGTKQYFKQEITLGSYGYAYAGDIPTQFVEVVPQTKTVTVFE